MVVTQVEPVVGLAERVVDAVGPATADGTMQVSLGELAANAGSDNKVGNPAELSGQVATGLRDLLQQSESINRLVGEDFSQAVARVRARETDSTVGAPGASTLMGPFAPGATGGIANAGLSLGGQADLPGPAERHPGLSLAGQWAKLQDTQDRAFIRYTEFAAYELESSELQKITEQLSNAVNSLVKSS